ncbi:methylase involved in ubiquinone/menaquinone biosynthesis [Halogeometricum borinquense DSM 11551]|uniref:Methylase involved in ubiquinone/menaquinone biosynthesis n=1 Tax=Halogeometricum borinquense (strain ATCC 700274 / DSM 11551 / JCM 10706 / KCTC 4070 / PR3) TaxID=469382 RepID=E4NSH9_HALBP|nr:class I SAM-dependent methyltransferase [Halogeometricum borinquense]ADQ66968.1 methylase involved in ubiquinone/menaquinone biosynthesis [Halogeometricum borinquense DSM 11551]ELY30049.1 methylase involved in ubiquinone/menaquinone biosynthesis [Halogeometricum borinquense DSM 11551]
MSRLHGRGDVRFFDRIAALYDLVMPSADADALQRGLSFARRPVERVLDVAGGTGRATRALARNGLEPVVVDFSRGMLSRARADGRDTVHADAGTLPFCDDSVDAIIVVDALHHMPDPDGAIREAARVVSPGGVVVVQEFGPDTLRGRGLVLAERAIGFDSQFWTPDELCAVFENAGLTARLVSSGFEYVVAGRVESAEASHE